MTTSLGATLTYTGADEPPSIPFRARRLEEGGFDSLRVSDHQEVPPAVPDLDVAPLASQVGAARGQAMEVARDPGSLRFVLRLVGPDDQASVVAGHLADLHATGVHEIIFDVSLDGSPARVHDVLRPSATR